MPERTEASVFQPRKPKIATSEEIVELRKRLRNAGEEGHVEHLDDLVKKGEPIEITVPRPEEPVQTNYTGPFFNLNNGFIQHRIEDRLGLVRGDGKLTVYVDDKDGTTKAKYDDVEIDVLADDQSPY